MQYSVILEPEARMTGQYVARNTSSAQHTMALPQEGNGTFVAVAPRQGSKAKRVAAIGFAVIVACAALVALVGQASEAPRSPGPTSLVALAPGGANPQINALAREFLEHGAQMTQAEAYNKIKNWNHDKHLAELMHTPARTQMLAAPNGLMTASQTQALAGDSLLCAKRDKIIELFDQLLAKLGGEELSANITMGKVTKAWTAAMSAWLTAESNYRLTVEKMQDAREGSSFAEAEYEKWKDAHRKAKADLEATLARHEAERQSLLDERELIKQIMRYIGEFCIQCPSTPVLHSSCTHLCHDSESAAISWWEPASLPATASVPQAEGDEDAQWSVGHCPRV